MSTGVRTILGIVEIVVGELLIDTGVGSAAGVFLVDIGIATLAGVAIQELMPTSSISGRNQASLATTFAKTDSYGALVYGIAKAGGVLVYMNTMDATNQIDLLNNPIPHPAPNAILDVVVVHCVTDPNIGIEGFGTLYINGKPIYTNEITYTNGTVNPDGFVVPVLSGTQTFIAGEVTSGLFAHMCEVHHYPGTQTTVPYDLSIGVVPEYYNTSDVSLDDNFIGNGLALTHFRFYSNGDAKAFRQAFGGTLPTQIGVVVKGEKVFDLTDTTQLITDKTTWKWSNNPALCTRDFLTRDALNGGMKFPAALLNSADLAASVNACRTQVNYAALATNWIAATAVIHGTRIIDSNGNRQRCTTAGTTGSAAPTWATSVSTTTIDGTVIWTLEALGASSGDLYKCSGIIDLGADGTQIATNLLSSMAGTMTQRASGQTDPVGEQISLLSGSWSSPAGVLDESFLRSKFQQGTVTQDKRYNVVKANFYDVNNEFKQMQAPAVPIYGSALYNTYISEDGLELDKQISLSMTNNADNAQLVSQVVSRQSRYLGTIKALCNFRGLAYNVGDRVQVNNKELNWSLITYKIVRIILNPDYSCDLNLVMDDSSIYLSTVPNVGTFINPPINKFTIPPLPIGVSATTNTGGVHLSWDALPPIFWTTLEIHYSSTQLGTYTKINSASSGQNSFIHPLSLNSTGWYKLRYFNGSQYSNFTTPISGISGLSEAGSNVTETHTSAKTTSIGDHTQDELPDGQTYARQIGRAHV